MVANKPTTQGLPASYREKTWGEIIRTDWIRHKWTYLMVLPVIIFYIVWAYAPMYGIQIAFKTFSPKKGILGSEFIGLRHFADFFRSPYAWRVIRNTLLISFWNLVFGFPAPILLALMLNELRANKFKRVVQTITYMPHFISIMVISGILVDFSRADGLFNSILALFGFTPTNFLAEPKYFRTIYVGSDIWQGVGWGSIIFLSALSGIDQELYEAATIDGAGRLRQTWHITLPGILPTIAILLILRMGSMMSVGFEKIILLYRPLTYETADVISSYVYRKGINESNFGFSTAVGLFNSVVNFALVIFANKMSGILTETSLW